MIVSVRSRRPTIGPVRPLLPLIMMIGGGGGANCQAVCLSTQISAQKV